MTWLIQEVQATPDAQQRRRRFAWSRTLIPGLLAALLIALAAGALEALEVAVLDHRIIEALVIAMLIGVALANTAGVPDAVRPGATFASRTVLELAVVLLGASIDIQQVFDGGARLVLAVTLGVTFGLAVTFLLGRALGLENRLAYLVAVGNAICGNSAIAAVAPVVNAERREIASAIGLTAIAGVLVILVLPVALPEAGVSHYQYGIVVGMAVYAVPQVVAAAFAVSTLSAEVATLVKLMRVMFLGPVVIATGIAMRLRGGQASTVSRSQLLPWFVIGFFLLLSLRSLGAVPDGVVEPLREGGKALTILAMAGLGLGVEFAAIRNVGPRVGITSVVSMATLVCVSIALAAVLDLNG